MPLNERHNKYRNKYRDKRRQIKDRLANLVIKSGGYMVLIALLLMIFYLVKVVAPIFYGPTVKPIFQQSMSASKESPEKVVGMSVADNGETAFIFDDKGAVALYDLTNSRSGSAFSNRSTPIWQQQVVSDAVAFQSGGEDNQWFAYADNLGQVIAVQPSLVPAYSDLKTSGSKATGSKSQGSKNPKLTPLTQTPILLNSNRQPLDSFDFSITAQQAIFVGYTQPSVDNALDNKKIKPWHAVILTPKTELNSNSNESQQWQAQPIQLPVLTENTTSDQAQSIQAKPINQDKPINVVDYRLTPNGQRLYVLTDAHIWVLTLDESRFVIKEKVNIENINPVALNLLSGANSLLLTDAQGRVTQWFDVLKNGERHLTYIRDFELQSPPSFLLPDAYRKGFYSLHENGELLNFHTTTNQPIINKKLTATKPVSASMSSNERYLLIANSLDNEINEPSDFVPQSLNLYKISDYYPEVSFSALWSKVWYEGYPEPDYVWQSTATNKNYEVKFSLVPLAFGTLKAALFALLFSVPIAICGAIYTAYFMTDRMRSYVKPSIELMEAFPSVIVGFLAGVWLAPMVETNLFATLLLLLTLPVIILITAWGWHKSVNSTRYTARFNWLFLGLIPILVIYAFIIIRYSHRVEDGLFAGDLRLFLANIGIDFEQRNTLIVGFAMGFAVIPTIFSIAEDALFSVPKHLSEGASALGATQWQCLTTVVLPTASPGIFSAVMMGLGRAVGETMIVLMVTGNTPIMDWNILEGLRSFSANIAIEMPESAVGSAHFRLLFLSAFLLFCFTFVVNSIAELVRQRLRDNYRGM